ncbi:MAG: hypothetical protein GWO24_12185, partial [Akkermansiaceae bacterium]|nr:hypothetical protein [Akkermansiaceae bacterium]
MKALRAVVLAAGMCCSATGGFGAEVFEVTKERVRELPGGKEADGIIGDFVLRSDKVEAVISHKAPLRRANMSTFYGEGGITPGCLYDLTLRGADNDQITILAPLDQRGEVSYVRVVPSDEVGGNEAAVETVVTAAVGGGVYRRYRYIVTDGVQGVTILTTLRNEGKGPVTIKMQDKWTGLGRADYAKGYLWGDAVDPADKAGYALAWVKTHGVERTPRGEEKLEPGESLTVSRFLAVGTSPLEAVGVAAARRGDVVKGGFVIRDPDGNPTPTAKVLVEIEKGKTLVGYPNTDHVIPFGLPAGNYPYRAVDGGRADYRGEVNLKKGTGSRVAVELGPQSAVVFRVTDEGGKSIPCKVQFEGIGGT